MLLGARLPVDQNSGQCQESHIHSSVGVVVWAEEGKRWCPREPCGTEDHFAHGARGRNGSPDRGNSLGGSPGTLTVQVWMQNVRAGQAEAGRVLNVR